MILQGDGGCRGDGQGTAVLNFESHSTKFGHGEGRTSACNRARGLVGHLIDKCTSFKELQVSRAGHSKESVEIAQTCIRQCRLVVEDSQHGRQWARDNYPRQAGHPPPGYHSPPIATTEAFCIVHASDSLVVNDKCTTHQ